MARRKNKMIINSPDIGLEGSLEYLKNALEASPENVHDVQYLQLILEEDKQLLIRLAQ